MKKYLICDFERLMCLVVEGKVLYWGEELKEGNEKIVVLPSIGVKDSNGREIFISEVVECTKHNGVKTTYSLHTRENVILFLYNYIIRKSYKKVEVVESRYKDKVLHKILESAQIKPNFKCKYCGKNRNKRIKDNDLVFSENLGYYIHQGCLITWLLKEPNNLEARMLAREILGIKLPFVP